jgi:hypothetical protein
MSSCDQAKRCPRNCPCGWQAPHNLRRSSQLPLSRNQTQIARSGVIRNSANRSLVVLKNPTRLLGCRPVSPPLEDFDIRFRLYPPTGRPTRLQIRSHLLSYAATSLMSSAVWNDSGDRGRT